MSLQPSLIPLPDLAGQVAIVTGASRGIGKAIAQRLAEAGATVVVAAKSERSRDLLPGSIHQTVAEIEEAGGKALAMRIDLRDEAQVAALVADTLEQCGRIDLLVNNAGALWMQPVAETPLKRFDLVHAINARAPFLAASLCLPAMRAQGWGADPQHLGRRSSSRCCPARSPTACRSSARACSRWGWPPSYAANPSRWPRCGRATIVESQASINHNMGGPEWWRKPEVVADAVLAWMTLGVEEASGKVWLDEEVLAAVGVEDLSPYNCVEGGQPMRIVGVGGWPKMG